MLSPLVSDLSKVLTPVAFLNLLLTCTLPEEMGFPVLSVAGCPEPLLILLLQRRVFTSLFLKTTANKKITPMRLFKNVKINSRATCRMETLSIRNNQGTPKTGVSTSAAMRVSFNISLCSLFGFFDLALIIFTMAITRKTTLIVSITITGAMNDHMSPPS